MCKYANEYIFANTSDKLNSEPEVSRWLSGRRNISLIELLMLATQLKKSTLKSFFPVLFFDLSLSAPGGGQRVKLTASSALCFGCSYVFIKEP